jgi:hypothetical protein
MQASPMSLLSSHRVGILAAYGVWLPGEDFGDRDNDVGHGPGFGLTPTVAKFDIEFHFQGW